MVHQWSLVTAAQEVLITEILSFNNKWKILVIETFTKVVTCALGTSTNPPFSELLDSFRILIYILRLALTWPLTNWPDHNGSNWGVFVAWVILLHLHYTFCISITRENKLTTFIKLLVIKWKRCLQILQLPSLVQEGLVLHLWVLFHASDHLSSLFLLPLVSCTYVYSNKTH